MSTPIENNTEELQTILQAVNNLPNAGGGFSIPVIDLAELGFENIVIGGEQTVQIDNSTYEQYADLMRKGIVQIKCSCEQEIYPGFIEPTDYVLTATVGMTFVPGEPEEVYNSFVTYEVIYDASYFAINFILSPYNEAILYTTNKIYSTAEG
jgi:hypothetical protein